MNKDILAAPKGYQLAKRKISVLCFSLSFILTAVTTLAPQAQSQVPIGLGISLGSMLISGIASGHSRQHNKKVNVRNQAIKECNRGTKLLKQNQYQLALDAYRRALEIDPSLLDAHWNSAVVYKKLRDYDHALAEAQIVLQRKPADADAMFMAATASQHSHLFAQADQYYQWYLCLHKTGENAEFAQRSSNIIEHVFLSAPNGDYVADATKEGIARWQNDKMPLKIFIKEDPTVFGYTPEFATALKQAFMDWSVVSESKISFAFTDQESEAQIICAWTSERLQTGGTEELGLTHTEREGNTIIAAKIDLYTIADRPELRKDELIAAAKQVDLHEIGHALGLNHSQQPYDIMYFETAPDGLEFLLTLRDRNTILAIYDKPYSQISQIPTDSGLYSPNHSAIYPDANAFHSRK